MLNSANRIYNLGLVACLIPAFTGCQTPRYYAQAVAGQTEIFSRERPIKKLLATPQTPDALRERLEFVLKIRRFAAEQLRLAPDGHYLKYADLGRRFVVWNVYATPEFSLKPKTWWYPVVGRLKYQGYFSETGAREYAAKLEQKGNDVYVGGVEAYSTLGWFKDPVLNTFIFDEDAELVELLFHELAHQRVFAKGDTDFNEAFATAVAEEGLRRWLLKTHDRSACKSYHSEREHKNQFIQLVCQARVKLENLYAEKTDPASAPRNLVPNSEASNAAKRIEKERIFQELRLDYERLRAGWGNDGKYDAWFKNAPNNAKLNTVETYYKLVPAFEELLRRHNGDLEIFYQEAKALAKLKKEKRQDELASLLKAAQQHR